MKIRLLIFIFFLVAFSVNGQSVDVFNLDHMKGKVKSIVQFEWKEDTISAAREIKRTFFDKNGSAIRAEYQRASHLNSVLPTYNAVGLLVKECYVSEGDTTYKYYDYDEEKRLVKKEYQSVSEAAPNFVIEYNYDQNRIIESKFYANRVFCDLKETYKNIEGNDSLVLKRDVNGVILNWVNYSYADRGRYVLRESRSEKDGDLDYYSETFHLSDTIFVDSTYDKNGDLMDNVKLVSFSFNETAYMKFDVIAEGLHDESVYEYVFDTYGNWITQKAYLNGTFWFMRKREITYFD